MWVSSINHRDGNCPRTWRVWNKLIPLKIYSFAWRVMRNSSAVDLNVKKKRAGGNAFVVNSRRVPEPPTCSMFGGCISLAETSLILLEFGVVLKRRVLMLWLGDPYYIGERPFYRMLCVCRDTYYDMRLQGWNHSTGRSKYWYGPEPKINMIDMINGNAPKHENG